MSEGQKGYGMFRFLVSSIQEEVGPDPRRLGFELQVRYRLFPELRFFGNRVGR